VSYEEHDDYRDDPPLCGIHGCELDGDYCESCALEDYERALTPEDDGDDERYERERDRADDAYNCAA